MNLVRITFCVALSACLLPIQSASAAEPLNRQFSPGEYRKPAETARMMKLPKGFQVQVFAGEPDVVQPIAFCIDPRGRLWVVENHSYPTWKPTGKDRVVIFEDTNGDGQFDKRKVFWDQGNFITGIQVGFGGVWIGSPPNLLFIPDRDGDDKPDGQPVVLLDGWGHHDTHETLNSFIWGPDGWLYGCQGVFTHSKVGKPGASDKQRTSLNAGIWRYHPTRHEFEIFAEGGSNQWGLDFNDSGQAFMTACVIPHLYHVVQGGRYQRQAGQHFNPHTYFDIQTIRTHNHFAAAFAGAMIYLGDNFPDMYRNQIFMNNIHANKVHVDWLERKGSGYLGKFGPHDQPVKPGRQFAPPDQRGAGFINSGDHWYRGLCLRTGPDGGVLINDWYDKRACHQLHPNDQDFDFGSGRIYKVTYGKPARVTGLNLNAADDEQLVKYQLHRNDWYVRTARRILQERAAAATLKPDTRDRLLKILRENPDATRKLRALWALHGIGGIDQTLTLELLGHPNQYVRAWAIQCEMEDSKVSSPSILAKLRDLAENDPSPVVRLYLASACQRMEENRAILVERLIAHTEDAEDQNLPQMYWYALEPICAADKKLAVRMVTKTKIPILRQYIAKRITAD